MANDRNAGRKQKLSPLEQYTIYESLKAGEKPEKLALQYDISLSTVFRIKKRHESALS